MAGAVALQRKIAVNTCRRLTSVRSGHKVCFQAPARKEHLGHPGSDPSQGLDGARRDRNRRLGLYDSVALGQWLLCGRFLDVIRWRVQPPVGATPLHCLCCISLCRQSPRTKSMSWSVLTRAVGESLLSSPSPVNNDLAAQEEVTEEDEPCLPFALYMLPFCLPSCRM